MRTTTPRPFVGVLLLVAYLVVFYGIWIVNGIDYTRIGESAETILRWYVAPLAGGAVVLVVAATVLGWWRPALAEKERAPRWLIVSPVFMVVGAVAILASKDYSRTTAAMVLLLVVGSVLVGFCEELATRGLLLVGLRGRYTEGWAWFLSSLLFGLMHLPNWVFGAGPAALSQVGLAFSSGTALYLARRTTGSLVWAMAIHGLWDFASFIGTGGGLLPVAVVIANGLLALVLVIFALRPTRGRRLEQFGTGREPQAATA